MQLLCSVLNFFARPLQGISEKVRSRVRTTAYFGIFIAALLYGSAISGVHILIKCVIGVLFMGVAILFSVEGEVKPAKWSVTGTVLWFGLGALQLLSGLLVSLEYMPMAMIWLVGFPAFYTVYASHGDRMKLFSEIARAANCTVVIMLVSSVLLVPLEHSQYGGILHNPNGVGQWLTLGFPVLLFLYYNGGGSRRARIFYIAEAAEIFLFLFISRGRTAVIAVAAMSAVFIACRLIFVKNGWRYWVKKIPICAVTVILTVSVTVLVNGLVAEHLGDIIDFDSFFKGGVFDTIDKDDEEEDEPPQIGELFDSFIGRFLGLDKLGVGLNNLSSGRVGIWIKTFSMLNLLGHRSTEHIVTDRNGDVGVNVHNTPLQYAFDNGIFAGIMYTVLVVYGLVAVARRAWRSRTLRSTDLYFFIIHIGFCVTIVLSSITLPFLYTVTFMYYVTYASVLEADGKKAVRARKSRIDSGAADAKNADAAGTEREEEAGGEGGGEE